MSSMIYLASRSPRRQALLAQLGVRFEVRPASRPGQPGDGQSPADYAVGIALAKARAIAAATGGERPVLGADTDVVLDGEVLGKPADADEAGHMLGRLSGRRHQVYSAVAVVSGDRERTALSVSEVQFAPLDERQIRDYVDSGEPMDKAGAYAIQGGAGRFVVRIEGSYSGIVGLPLYETACLLEGRAPPGAPA